MTFKDKMEHLIEAGFQAIYIATGERSRCEDELTVVANKLKLQFVTWDAVTGFSTGGDVRDPLEALLSLDGNGRKSANELIVMRNLHVFLDDPTVRQAFQNLYYGRKFSNTNYKRPVVMVCNAMLIHAEIMPCITIAEFSLPDESELTKVFDTLYDSIEVDTSKPGAIAKCDAEMKTRSVQAMRGMTTLEAENTLCYSLRVNRGFAPGLIETIEDQKSQALEKSEVLTYVPKDRIATMDEIGGYEELKSFMATRRMAYTKKARDLNLDVPRGIVLLGPGGTGKSVVAKVIARELGLPLVIMNVGAIYGSLVGESERRVRSALATIDALDGAVVLIDEAEKALGGANDSAGDGGVSRRVFGTLLTWLTEKRSRTFVVMTMNRTRGIPPEFLRRGRFDEIFYTDLPEPEERDQILRIHAKKRGVNVDVYKKDDWSRLIEESAKCVGSELEQAVCDARFASFAARQSGQPTVDELIAALPLVPMAVAEEENINEIRRSCENKARPVSKKVSVKNVRKSRTVNVI